ncbi:MAG: LysE family translocator [Shimia sp.]|uniref:LysE family translocator n=1 Tax=Shimia sp. TaxID=1954381 RepID=UPI003B8D1A4D
MDFAAWFPMVAFVTASTITPGPNSIMIMASGVNFGFRSTVPHILGVAVGITLVISLAGIGIGAILDLFPVARWTLLAASTVYLLYLAWKIANAAPPAEADAAGTPLTFVQALLFQAVNPKVWALGMAAVALFAPGFAPASVVFVALTFAGVGLLSNSAWGWFGTVIRRYLSTGRRLKTFNIVAALALVASLAPALF